MQELCTRLNLQRQRIKNILKDQLFPARISFLSRADSVRCCTGGRGSVLLPQVLSSCSIQKQFSVPALLRVSPSHAKDNMPGSYHCTDCPLHASVSRHEGLQRNADSLPHRGGINTKERSQSSALTHRLLSAKPKPTWPEAPFPCKPILEQTPALEGMSWCTQFQHSAQEGTIFKQETQAEKKGLVNSLGLEALG